LIDPCERERMLRAHSIGPRMIVYLEAIGITSLDDLRGANAGELAMRIDIHLGRKHINRHGMAALKNLIALAETP
jgi:hypothetical protein